MFSLSDGNQIFDPASKIGILSKLLPAGTSLQNALIAVIACWINISVPEVMKVMRRMKLDKIEHEVSSSPDIDSLIGMLKPLVKAGKWRSDVKEMVFFIRGASCQMHSTVHSIPLSQFWHLFHLLKGLVAYKRVELIVVSKDTPVEVTVDVCHVTKVVVHYG